MNNLGRERIAVKLAGVITDLFSAQEEVITLTLKSDTEMASGPSDPYDLDSDLTSREVIPTAPPAETKTPEAILDMNEQPDRDSDSDSDKGVDGVPSNLPQIMSSISVREDGIVSYDQTLVITHTMDGGNVSNSSNPAQNTSTSDENMVPSSKQDAAYNSISDQDSDSGEVSTGADNSDSDNSDSDSNTHSDIDSDDDPKTYVLLQDSITIAATEGTTTPPTRTHVDSDIAEIRRISTRNKKAPS
jgi:hypothetical protein